MLVLTRKPEESVILAGNIEIKVLGVRGDQVSIGFSAPENISIYRKEVYEAIEQENRRAAHEDSAESATSLTQQLEEGLSGPDIQDSAS
jgi:carbon storage regulator